MEIFISYASEQRTLAEEIAVALRAEGHQTFFDRAELTDGDAYNKPLREAIRTCDLLVFLVSPEAVQPGRYTLTELELAEQKWPSPIRHVLPVVVRPTDAASLPAYLRAVVMLRPAGNIPAAVVAAVDRLATPGWWRLLRRYAVVLGAIALAGAGFGGWRAVENWRICREALHSVEQGRLQQDAGDYTGAWDRYSGALAMCPRSSAAAAGQERLAMEWLDNIRATPGKESFTDITNRVQPALTRAAAAKDSRRAADALAHLGWADYLRARDGQRGLDPTRYYQRALQLDPRNPYAHAFWGHYIITGGGNVQEAKAHFSEALASVAERPLVRTLQLAALTWGSNGALQDEAARVANEMLVQAETLRMPDADATVSSLWNVYYDRLVRGSDKDGFLAALSPQDHLATFQWLFPKYAQSSNRYAYLFMLAQLQERNGDHAAALATYQSVVALFAAQGAGSGTVPNAARAAVQRLQRR